MHELRCPNCRLRLWLYQGMGRDVPLPHDCPACRAANPIEREPDVSRTHPKGAPSSGHVRVT